MNSQKMNEDTIRPDDLWQQINMNCAEQIATAIQFCKSTFSKGDTTNGAARSIRRKVKKHFDPCLNTWIEANNLSSFPNDFSGLLSIGEGQADKQIEIWGEFAKLKISFNADPSHMSIEAMSATIDSMRNFSRFCFSFKSKRIRVVRNNSENDLEPGTKRVGRKTGKQLNDRLSWYLKIEQENFCELCLNTTEAAIEGEERAQTGADIYPDALVLLKNDVSVVGSGWSTKYCEEHSSRDKFSHLKYERDSRRRIFYYSLICLIKRCRELLGLNGLTPEMLRSHAHSIVFIDKSVAIDTVDDLDDHSKPFPIHPVAKELKELPKVLSDYFESDLRFDRDLGGKLLIGQLLRIVAAAIRKGYDPEVAEQIGLKLERSYFFKADTKRKPSEKQLATRKRLLEKSPRHETFYDMVKRLKAE